MVLTLKKPAQSETMELSDAGNEVRGANNVRRMYACVDLQACFLERIGDCL